MEVKEREAYQAVIGLEFHAHIATRTKMFCGCRVSYGDEPNTHTCPVCLGHPGALPVANERAVELGVMAGLAMGCEVAPRAVFARKNYFYPDLPKGYQISQYEEPICTGGHIDVQTSSGTVRVRIRRLHLEEDTAKNVHVGTSGRMHGSTASLIDFNRSGTPLMEIVTEPDIPSAEAARETALRLRDILRAVGASEADMEKGQLRCEANVSIRNPDGSLGTRTELKNINSFRFMERAIERELRRQREIVASGGTVRQTTIHYDPEDDEVYETRSKEYAEDYRYFPEPDLLPLQLSEEWVEGLRARLPELPEAMRARFIKQYGLSEEAAGVLTVERELAAYYEEVAAQVDPRQAANWISGDLRALLNESGLSISECKILPGHMAELIGLVQSGDLSRSAAKEVLERSFETGERPQEIVEREGLGTVGGDELSGIVERVISSNPEEARRVREGDRKVVGFLIGQVMRETRGNADGGKVREILMEKLGS
ncbi:Asp-tRNA(Asn)/Glu-tRNA(Gln) amidotransferase subunit GatB [Rubrobacter calidifluminis]|uniref:Asp-tRNA(Asn)/Glu-tRNA(Gln) amidotransferase subunit GatB n=1 Tax=Rubrobacter calidifluminis TaxID=1392640 RepID=UPI002362F4CA|nr:Asp-tRNA(Asn)/Glu-tRNA(Gln) amidotransferase subunit GatB [Rubrobacter calidifluminis]